MLNLNHIRDLESSGLSEETRKASMCFSVSADQASKGLGFPIECPALAFPYPDDSGTNGTPTYIRYKPDIPHQPPGWTKPAKYLAPLKSKNRLYIAPSLDQSILKNPAIPIIVTEGEKKALCAIQEGFSCLGFSGVWNWSAGRDVETRQRHIIPDVDRITWNSRTVYLCYDSDAVTNQDVLAAERAIAKELQARGATVLIARLPALPDLHKTGLDDFLVHRGAYALQKILDQAQPPPPDRSFSNTDDGNADRLVALHGEDLRYCYEMGWLNWDDKRWVADQAGEIHRRAVNTIKAIPLEAVNEPDQEKYSNLLKHAARSLSYAKRKAMISSAESKLPMPVRLTDFDTDPFALNLENGTLDLRTGELQAHSRQDLHMKLAPVSFDPKATCPNWRAFLDRIMGGDKGLIGFLQKAIGYSLTGSTQEECLFILYGVGANGKSTVLETIGAMMGDYAMQTPIDTLMIRKNDSQTNDIARLKGARFVSSIETEEGSRFAESKLKQLTGGDRVAARFLHKEFFEFTPEFKLWMACNHRPVIYGTDDGIWRRIRLIPFEVQIPTEEQDPALKGPGGKLQAELPGILKWALKGLGKWQKQGMGKTAAIASATQGYRSGMDALGIFIEDCCYVNDKANVRTSDLYAAYQKWCEAGGESTLSQKALGSKLRERGFVSVRPAGVRSWAGIGLLSPRNDEKTS